MTRSNDKPAHRHGERNIRLAFVLNLSFTLIEIVGGLWTNSLAILADAIHDLGDSISLGLAWYFERVSLREGTQRFSYGFGRFSLLSAVITATVLIAGSLFILCEAIPRILNPEPSHAFGMILLAIAGITVNGAGVLRMRRETGLNAKIVTWHLLEDVLGWIAVLMVGTVLMFWELYILDPILSCLITLYVLFNVAKYFRTSLNLFLQGVPEEIDIAAIENRLRSLPFVISTHHTHIWSLDGEHHVLSTHVVVGKERTREEVIRVKEEIRRLLQDYRISHTTVEVEYADESCRLGHELTCYIGSSESDG